MMDFEPRQRSSCSQRRSNWQQADHLITVLILMLKPRPQSSDHMLIPSWNIAAMHAQVRSTSVFSVYICWPVLCVHMMYSNVLTLCLFIFLVNNVYWKYDEGKKRSKCLWGRFCFLSVCFFFSFCTFRQSEDFKRARGTFQKTQLFIHFPVFSQPMCGPLQRL